MFVVGMDVCVCVWRRKVIFCVYIYVCICIVCLYRMYALYACMYCIYMYVCMYVMLGKTISRFYFMYKQDQFACRSKIFSTSPIPPSFMITFIFNLCTSSPSSPSFLPYLPFLFFFSVAMVKGFWNLLDTTFARHLSKVGN